MTDTRVDPLELWTLEEVSKYLRTPEPTLRYWRHRGEGPKSFRMGRRVMYTRQDVEEWVRARMAADEVVA